MEEIKNEIQTLKMELAEATSTLIKLEQERKNSVVAKLFNAVGGISGLLSIVLIVYSGGKVVNRVETMETKLANIEKDGTRVASLYMASNEQWKKDTEARLERFESAVLAILPALPRIEIKIDNLKETLDEHKRNTAKP